MQSTNDSRYSSSILTPYYLHITLDNIEIRHNKKFTNVYFSFVHKGVLYFTSTIDSQTAHVNDDVLMMFQCEDDVPDFIKLQRWENHYILLQHEIDIVEVKTRNFVKKKIETKQHEIISLTFHLYSSNELQFFNSPVKVIPQHYLKISKFSIKQCTKQQKQTQNNNNSSNLFHFHFLTREQKYTVPVINSQLVIKWPCELQIVYFENDVQMGRTQWVLGTSTTKIVKDGTLSLGLFNQQNLIVSKLQINLQWITNLSYKRKPQSTILSQANELCIYDIELKLENFAQHQNSKLKFVYGSKAYEITGQLNHRIVQFQRIIYMIIKSQDEQVAVYCQRMNKIVAQARFHTADILTHKVVIVKKYLTDPVSRRPLGYVKFLCERAKNLSLPSSNVFWREFKKKKNPSKLYLRIQQLSVESNSQNPLFAVIKTEKQQYQIDPIINISNLYTQTTIHQPLLICIQQKLSVYMVIKQHPQQEFQTNNNNQSDFLGISSINYQQLRLGANPVKITFFKNQQQTLQANCIINKIVTYPFVKSILQQDLPLPFHTKSFPISVEILFIKFEPYFYTFLYEKKSQVYCIIQIGKLKKVIVLEENAKSELMFQVANASDGLNFLVNESDFIKGKLTFLVSSLGKEEQVYGRSTIKFKPILFNQNPTIKLTPIQIKNSHSLFIGSTSLQIKKGLSNSPQVFSKKDIKKIKNQMIKVNENIEKVQRSFSKNKSILLQGVKTPNTERRSENKKSLPVRYVSRKRYEGEHSGIKLPKI